MRFFFFVPLMSAMLFGVPLDAAPGSDLTGVWEIRSLRGDRKVLIWQSGNQITAYRVMYPEFEGERYKLENLYRGKITGTKIEGEMLVREEGMRSFENLRSFDGSVDSNGRITLDGMPVEKLDEKLTSKPPRLEPEKRRSSQMPKVTVVFPRTDSPERGCGWEVV